MGHLRFARNERRIAARRSLTSTLPGDLAPAASRAWSSDRPSWCVDRGATLDAMTTCDLWLALARGDVTPETKVWREGMPYWNQVARVPEFALALPGSSVWEPGSTAGPRRAEAGATEATAESAEARTEGAPMSQEYETNTAEISPVSEVRAAGSGTSESATMAAAADLVTPAPVVVEEREPARPASQARRRAFPKIDRASALSVAIGATLAVLALMLATTLPAPGGGAGSRSAAQHVAAGAPVRGVELPMPVVAEERTADRTVAAAPSAEPNVTESAASSRAKPRDGKAQGPRPLDRGQRRARTGTGDVRQ